MRSASTRIVQLVPVVLVCVPVAQASTGVRSVPMGTIVQAARANHEIDAEAEGTTLFDGDTLPINGESSLLARLGKSQMYLELNSSVILHHLPKGFSISLTSGTVRIDTGPGETFEAMADGIAIRPVGDAPVLTTITRVSDREINMTSHKDTLRVFMADQVDMIQEGHSYRLDVRPVDSLGAANDGQKPKAPGRNYFTIVMIAGVSVGAGIAAWRALVSPCKP